MRPNSLAVIGLGAIGGSVAWQARLAGVPRVVGYTLDRADAVQALKSAAVHDLAESPERAVKGAEMVVLAAPPGAVLELLGRIGRYLAPGAIVTDVASLKAPILARAREAGLADRFAGSHPFAGTHLSGWQGASPDRLRGVIVYVCPTGPSGDHAARQVMHLWEEVFAAHPVLIEAEAHDQQLAWTSHLPQAAATALARTLAGEASLRGASFATGARDTTRLAASPPAMWAEILLMNREAVLPALARLGERLAELGRLLQAGDRAGLGAYLDAAAAFRTRLEQAAGPVGAAQRRVLEDGAAVEDEPGHG
jgi:prephenate dehydrogenase